MRYEGWRWRVESLQIEPLETGDSGDYLEFVLENIEEVCKAWGVPYHLVVCDPDQDEEDG